MAAFCNENYGTLPYKPVLLMWLGERRMATAKKKWERAARLYLMASDAYGRGDAELAEMLVARGNQYADEAAAQAAQQPQQPQQGEAVVNSRN